MGLDKESERAGCKDCAKGGRLSDGRRCHRFTGVSSVLDLLGSSSSPYACSSPTPQLHSTQDSMLADLSCSHVRVCASQGCVVGGGLSYRCTAYVVHNPNSPYLFLSRPPRSTPNCTTSSATTSSPQSCSPQSSPVTLSSALPSLSPPFLPFIPQPHRALPRLFSSITLPQCPQLIPRSHRTAPSALFLDHTAPSALSLDRTTPRPQLPAAASS